MKSSTHQSFLDRRFLTAAALTLLLGTTPLAAQTGSGTGSTGSGSSSSSSRDTQSSSDTSNNSGSYGTSATGSSTTGSSGTSGSTSATDTSTSGSTSVTGSTSTDTAGGATTMTGRNSSSNKLGWSERRFVNKAADSGTTELELAKLAVQRASNPEVKSYAEKLVQDHQMVNQELKSLASRKNVDLDEEDLGSDRTVKRLGKKSGHEFDQEFVEQMVEMHENDVKMFEKAAEDAKDSDLKSFASKHVDHLRDHLQKAESLRSTIMPTGRTDDSGLSTSGSSSSSTTTDATSGTSSSGTTSGTSGTTGTPGTNLGSSTNSGSGTGSTSSDSSGSGSTGSSSSDPSRTPQN